MKLKITLERPQGATDLVLTAAADATIGDVATALIVRTPTAGDLARRGPLANPAVPVRRAPSR